MFLSLVRPERISSPMTRMAAVTILDDELVSFMKMSAELSCDGEAPCRPAMVHRPIGPAGTTADDCGRQWARPNGRICRSDRPEPCCRRGCCPFFVHKHPLSWKPTALPGPAGRPAGSTGPVSRHCRGSSAFGVKLAKFRFDHVGLVAFPLRGKEWQSLSTK